MGQQQYKVEGMTCEHCVASVTEEVSELPDVQNVQVQLDGGTMTVEAGRSLSFDEVAGAVAAAGDYTVVEA